MKYRIAKKWGWWYLYRQLSVPVQASVPIDRFATWQEAMALANRQITAIKESERIRYESTIIAGK